jgi:hypothetical protein
LNAKKDKEEGRTPLSPKGEDEPSFEEDNFFVRSFVFGRVSSLKTIEVPATINRYILLCKGIDFMSEQKSSIPTNAVSE